MARLTGKNGALYVSLNDGAAWSWVADLYEWALEIRTITFPASIKGDRADRRMPSHIEGRLTARRYVQSTLALASLAPNANNAIDGVTHAFTTGQRLQWAVVGVEPGFPSAGDPTGYSGNANVKAQGTGYVERGHVAAPRERLEDEFELIVDTLVSIQ